MSANSPSSNFWKTDFRLRAGARHFLTSLIIMVPSSNMLKLRRLRARARRFSPQSAQACWPGSSGGMLARCEQPLLIPRSIVMVPWWRRALNV